MREKYIGETRVKLDLKEKSVLKQKNQTHLVS